MVLGRRREDSNSFMAWSDPLEKHEIVKETWMIKSQLWTYLRNNISGNEKGRGKSPNIGRGLKHSGNRKGGKYKTKHCGYNIKNREENGKTWSWRGLKDWNGTSWYRI